MWWWHQGPCLAEESSHCVVSGGLPGCVSTGADGGGEERQGMCSSILSLNASPSYKVVIRNSPCGVM